LSTDVQTAYNAGLNSAFILPTYNKGKGDPYKLLSPALVSKGETIVTQDGKVERIKGKPNFKDNVLTEDPAFVASNDKNPMTGNRFSDDFANLPYAIKTKKSDWLTQPTDAIKNTYNA